MGCEGRIISFKFLIALVPTSFFLFDVPALMKGVIYITRLDLTNLELAIFHINRG